MALPATTAQWKHRFTEWPAGAKAGWGSGAERVRQLRLRLAFLRLKLRHCQACWTSGLVRQVRIGMQKARNGRWGSAKLDGRCGSMRVLPGAGGACSSAPMRPSRVLVARIWAETDWRRMGCGLARFCGPRPPRHDLFRSSKRRSWPAPHLQEITNLNPWSANCITKG